MMRRLGAKNIAYCRRPPTDIPRDDGTTRMRALQSSIATGCWISPTSCAHVVSLARVIALGAPCFPSGLLGYDHALPTKD